MSKRDKSIPKSAQECIYIDVTSKNSIPVDEDENVPQIIRYLLIICYILVVANVMGFLMIFLLNE